MQEKNQLNQDVEKLTKQVSYLEKISIKETLEPLTFKYLKKAINNFIDEIFTTKPTSTYSTFAPTGVRVSGSTWYVETGVLATREIYVSNGSIWIKFK